MLHSGKSATMLPSMAASSSGHWNQDGSRRWHLADLAAAVETQPDKDVTAKALDEGRPFAGAAGDERIRACSDRPFRQGFEQLANEAHRLLDFENPDPEPGIDVAVAANGDIKRKSVVGGIAGLAAGIEVPARGPPHETACRELDRKLVRKDAGRGRPVLQRGGVVVKLEQPWRTFLDEAEDIPDFARPSAREVAGHPAGHDRVHHQAMTECGHRSSQHPFAQDREMSQHEREGGVVADGADVAEMIGDALQLGHDGPQGLGAGPHGATDSRFHGARKGQRVGDGAVPRDATGKAGGGLDRTARHEPFDASVHVAEPLLEADHGLAAGREAEMARLDDPGMHGTDRNLMQLGPFGGQEAVARFAPRRGRLGGQRMTLRPAAVIEPRPRIRASFRDEPREIGDRPFEADGRRMHAADRGVTPIRTGEAQNCDRPGGTFQHGHVNHIGLGPQSNQ